MRVQTLAWAFISEDSAGEIGLAGNADESNQLEQLDGFSLFTNDRRSIAAASTEALSMGDITTAKGLWLQANGPVLVTLNGGDALSLNVDAAASYGRMMLDTDITAISVENESATAAVQVTYILWA